MILRRLDLEGFGRFRGRAIELAAGLNVLFGPNEAGKSTLHAFLDGMLFGFRQTRTQQGRQRSRRAYTPERDRYRPWDGGSYAGAMVYEHDGRSYLVRRDFAGDTLTIQDALTGRDVSAEFDLDPVTGERDFARRHGGLSPLTFRNTLSVGQAAAQIDRGALAPELREILLHAGAPADTGVKGAIAALQAGLDAVGTARRSASPLGRAHARVAELESRRDRALASLALTRELEAVQARLERARAAAEAAQAERDRLERARAGARLRQAEELQAAIDAIAPFPTARLDELALRQQAVEDTERTQRAEAEAEAARTEELAAAEAAVPRLAGLAPERLAEARGHWQQAEALRQRALAAGHRRERLRQLAGIGDDTLAAASRLADASRAGPWPLAAAAGLLALLAGLALHAAWLLVAGLALAAVGTWRWIAARRARAALARLLAAAGAGDLAVLARLDDERRVLRAQPDEDPAELLRLAADREAAARSILGEVGAVPGDWDELQHRLALAREALAAAQLAARRRQDQAARARAAGLAAAKARAELDAYLEAHGVATAEEFTARAEAAGRRQALQTRLEGLLAGTSLAELRARFPDGPPPADPGATDSALARAHAAWLTALSDLQSLREQEAALRQRIGPRPEDLGAVEADLRHALAERDLLEARREALALALGTIEELQQAVQREFAPVLHRRLAELAPGLTGGRYRELHVDEGLNVTVAVPERSDLVPAEHLSRGAMDQIYLAARVALAEMATGGAEAPLLLDDSLAHFDDDRLAAALACLADLAAARQILLFTCHGRVLTALRRAGASHHLVTV